MDRPKATRKQSEECLGEANEDGFDPSCFHVCALGASAGGLESLERFFKAMPSDSGMAFIVLQHLSPDFRSVMDELLARHTKMTIRKAEDDMEVEPNTIYLNPPRKNMIISGGHIYLSDIDPNESLSLPIDQFFRSLAQDYRRQAVAVVLSGTGSDGSRGVRDVYEAGGLVLSETEETAKFDGMPRAAQETGCVHLVLQPDAMPESLVSYVNQALSPQDFAEKVCVPPRLGGMDTAFRLLREEYGIDFSYYKPNTVVRRIERRVSMSKADTIEEYVEQLTTDHDELNALYRDLLIGVTRFFRDREAFDYIASDVLPQLIDEKEAGDELRIWVAGAATGEEAYSLAIFADEAMQAAGKSLDIKVFATDVHPASLEFASNGVYPKESVATVEKDRLAKYFRSTPEGYQVIARLRQMIVFARHNVFKDAPFTKLDLVSCRNLLIYLQPLAQRKVLSLFHFGLRSRGVMMLGPSESLGDLKEEFESLNNRWKVFRKRRDVRLPPEMRLQLPASTSNTTQVKPAIPATETSAAPQRHLMQAYDRLLEHFVSAAFLIDDARNVLHVFGKAVDYMQPRSGRMSVDLLEVVRPELKPILASAIQRVRRGIDIHVTTAMRLNDDDGSKDLKIDVMRLSDSNTQQSWFVVALEERAELKSAEPVEEKATADELSRGRVEDLETELSYTKESLQTTVEELETSNEELQATNEELVASNEELQSTNEELHSVNEELYTVNAEYQNKITELTELTEDMDNLLESTEIGTIFLDEELAIRKFTGKVETWFDLLKRDVGRKISAFSHNLSHPDLMGDIRKVLESQEPRETEVKDNTGKWLHLRLHPYRSDGDTGGVVMTLIDVSSLKQTRAKLQRLSAIVESSDDAIIGKNFSGQIESWNAAAERLFGYTAKEAIGNDVSLIMPEDVVDEAQQFFDQIRGGESVDAIEVRRRTKSGQEIEISVRFSPIRDESGNVVGFSAVCRDITDQKRAEREITKLSLVARHTDNAVVITDAQGFTEWVNEGFTRISGFTAEDIHGRKPGHLLQGPDSDEKVISHMREQIAAGEGFNVEIVNYTKDKRPYWLAIEARPLHDDGKQLTGFMAVQRDVTALKSAQQQARDEVDRRDTFLAMLSHELRNPLSAIKNGLEVLDRERNTDTSTREEIEEVLRTQVTQMSRLLDDLLDVSRLTQDKIAVRRQPMDLRRAAEAAAAAVKPLAMRRGCELILNLPETPVIVEGDSARLQQVQVNLLTNAMRHSHMGDPVTLEIKTTDTDAVITVTDIGEGMDRETQTKIFEMFFQNDSDLARTEGGLGVGLSLVQEFVAKHGGQVSVHSDGPGQGACFTVRLPLSEATESETSDTKQWTCPPLRIVVVEDQLANRVMLRRMLEMDGHQVWEAENGRGGLETIQNVQPDVALVDIGLPDLAGYDVAQQVRANGDGNATFLAALTGYGQPSDVEKALQSGFNAHLTKPLDLEKLSDVLQRVVNERHQLSDAP